ncbi:MAG: tetratricopeptide repeat protein, partial [Bacteroidota bacterium]
MRYLTLLLLFFSVSLPAQVPDLATITADSANSWAGERVYDPGDTVLFFLYDLLAKVKAEENYAAMAETASNLATWHYAHVESEITDSIKFYDELALAAHREVGDPVAIIRAASQLSTTYADQYAYNKAEALLFEADSLLKSLDEPELKANVYEKFVYLYRNSKDYRSAIEFGNRALNIYTSLPGTDSLDAMYSLFYLSGVYVMNKEPEKGLAAIERARKLVELAEHPEASGYYLRVYGLRGYALEAMGRYDDAMEDYQKSLEIAKQLVPEEEMADGYKDGIGTIHYLRGEYEEAIPLLQEYLQHIGERGAFDPTYSEKYLNLSDAYAKTKQYDKALEARDSGRVVKVRELEKELAAVRGELR